MCLFPRTIINKKKYFDVTRPEQLVLQVPCNHCSECLQSLSNQYKFRAFHEFKDTVSRGGFAYFDTLTYSLENLPHVSDFYDIRPDLDVPCFNHSHTRNFINSLRTRLKRLGYPVQGNLNYFLVSEYGTSDYTIGKTGRVYKNRHMPHYHIVFFVKFPVDPLLFSSLVSEYWYHGRTDGYPYKDSSYVLSHNTLYSVNLSSVAYITKYIQKSSIFQSVIDRRVRSIVDDYKVLNCPSDYELGLFRQRVYRDVGQFHRNGHFFGISYLSDADPDSLARSPFVVLPDCNKMAVRIPLPTYYKRHLFYNLICLDGRPVWQLNSLGNYYFFQRLSSSANSIKSHLDKLVLTYNLENIDTFELSNYLIFKRGRFSSLVDVQPLSLSHYRKSSSFLVYNYSSKLDEFCFGSRFFTTRFLGYSQYPFKNPRFLPDTYSYFVDFLKSYVFFDSILEQKLQVINGSTQALNRDKQMTFDYRQNLHNLFHYLNV